jgi:hypothetical protein
MRSLANHRIAAALLAVVAASCADPPGEFDPELVVALSKTVGDAKGYSYSGSYDVEITPEACECADELIVMGPVNFPCDAAGLFPLEVELVHTDGILLVTQLLMTGPVYEDETFELGSVATVETVLFSGRNVIRGEGSFATEDDGRIALTARVARHVVLDILQDGEKTRVDCVDRIAITGVAR